MEWEFFADDDSARSQWIHQNGMVLTFFAYPVSDDEERAQFREDFTTSMADAGRVLRVDEEMPAHYQGFRHLIETINDEGEPVTSFNYFVYDLQNQDIHQVFTAVPSQMKDEAEGIIEEFLAATEWIQPR